MYKNPPEGWPRISSSLTYEDPNAALEFLEKAFGFKTRARYAGEDGVVEHAELEFEEGLIMVGPPAKDPRAASPRSLNGRGTQSLFVFVDDVDGHCETARAAGAEIVREPEDSYYGQRVYGALDPEGHRWFFGQKTKESGPEADMPDPG
jgi:uncharacterized glyoxalase superfamily protein PhnB